MLYCLFKKEGFDHLGCSNYHSHYFGLIFKAMKLLEMSNKELKTIISLLLVSHSMSLQNCTIVMG